MQTCVQFVITVMRISMMNMMSTVLEMNIVLVVVNFIAYFPAHYTFYDAI